VRCALIGALAVVDATGHLGYPLILVIAFLFGLADGFFYPAFGGIVPLVVESHDLASANTLTASPAGARSWSGRPWRERSTASRARPPSSLRRRDVRRLGGPPRLRAAAGLRARRERGDVAIDRRRRALRGVPWLWIGISESRRSC
jgi:hypothetical protein